MKQVAIFGVSGFGREVIPLVRSQLQGNEEPYQLVFVDDSPPAAECNGHQVLKYSQWLNLPASSRHISIAIANGTIREKLASRCRADGVEFFEVRAQNALQFDNVSIGVGAILGSFVHITSNVRIGDHFHANIYSYVAHDCEIGNYVTFAPRVMCNGNVIIEDHAYVGTGAIIKQGQPGVPTVIGQGAIIGMGSVVTRSVPPGVTMVGNPAKPLTKF